MKKVTPTQVFSCEFCEISKSTASVLLKMILFHNKAKYHEQKYRKSSYISHSQQLVKSRNKIVDVIPALLLTKHTNTACSEDFWWTWNLSSEINSDDSFENGDSNISKEKISLGYAGEPERIEIGEILGWSQK